MAVQTITYANKSYINQNSGVADTNKVNDTDMNEIKSVVNNNATELTNTNTKFNNSFESGKIASNSMTTYSVGSDTYRYYDVVFTNTYTNPPTVVVSVFNNSISSYGAIQCGVSNITTTGCRVLFMVNISAASLGITYIVKGND